MNRLAQETSPYLRQHSDNPVDWFPWGSDAFAAAEERNVPVLLSVGYSSCHWCHVMAHECFEDIEVATRMNELFVNVKVDREERPDIDSIYMDAVQAMTGRGGWPMTVFMTAKGEPFYGGTYFPKESFLQLLEAIDDVHRNRPADLRQNVTVLHDAIQRTTKLKASKDLPGIDHLNTGVQALGRAFDSEWGGFGLAPKFPSTFNLELMTRAYMSTGADLARQIVTTSLDAMAAGGIYDHIGGGFARYSTDREWLIPHFEKMLYDQALIAKAYLHGHMVFGTPSWRQVVEETIDYVLSTLRHEQGGFFSAEDADSADDDGNGIEGLFATWTPAEVLAALPDGDPALVDEVLDWFGIDEAGDIDGRSIPNRVTSRGSLIRPPNLELARQQLLAARGRRRRPGLDDKVLTEWNALFLATLSEAAGALARNDWLEAAIANAEFLVRELRNPDGRWFRSWHADGSPPARHNALAADHAALIDAFTRLAEASGQSRWIDEATATADTMLDWFWDPLEGGLFTTAADAEALIVRQKDLADNATPSANSQAAIALLRLGALTGERRYEHHADRILQLVEPLLNGSIGMFSNMLTAVELRRRGLTEVVVAGDRPDLVRIAQGVWRPDAVLAWGQRYSSPLWEGRADGFAYVCRDYTCELPQDTIDGLAAVLTGKPLTSVRGE